MEHGTKAARGETVERPGDKSPGLMVRSNLRKARSIAHRPREERELRQFVGASVRAISKRQLEEWTEAGRRRRKPYNVGRALDELVDFGRRMKFRPAA